MGTSCHLNSLVCGQEYSVVVEAMNAGCPGPASAPATLTTGECNSNLTVVILFNTAPNLREPHKHSQHTVTVIIHPAKICGKENISVQNE